MNQELSPNTTLSHYRIISKLGAGGMGEVYLAQDTKLDRKVAIKFLHEEFSKDADKLGRFIQEAKAASALNHPNILTIHEIGELDGKNYIATELIDGKTLREHLSHKELLPLNTILKIGVQVSEALTAAHQAGIIHRDIKPENIMIRKDGYAKVLDFGLAKLTEPGPPVGTGSAGSEDATRVQVKTNPGMVMGTVSYMSPEQARGKVTDARTDIWSLGVVLYEMLSGKVPFTGETVNHTIVSILEKEPLRLESVPAELQRIVRKSMTKDVDMRYQTAHDLLIDLKNLRRDLDIQGERERSIIPNRAATTESANDNQTQVYGSSSVTATSSGQGAATHGVTTSSSSLEYAVTQAKNHKLATAIVALVLLGVISTVGYFAFASRGSSTKEINSIAVLPFENRSGSPDTDYLSDGLADSLIYRLSQLPNLKVSPTTSVMRYRGKETDVAQIAKELEVDAVMSGRLTQRGDDLSISVQLIDSRTKKLIWAEQYDRKMADLLATQREIATTITQKLKLRLAGDEAKGITKKYTDSNEAYQLYLKGRFHYAKRTKDDLNKGVDYFQQAVKLDPNFALAYAMIADSYASMPAYPHLSPKEALPRAKAAAARALEIDPTLAEAHTAMGYSLCFSEREWAEAERSLRRALELEPKNSLAHLRFGIYFLSTGHTSEALKETQTAVELEPLNLVNGANLTWTLLSDGRKQEALAQGKKMHDLEPNFILGGYQFGLTYNANGMYADAIALAEKTLQTDPDNQLMLVVAGYAYAKSGRRGDATTVIDRYKAIRKTQYVISYFVAAIYAGLNDTESAFTELEKAYQESDWRMAAQIKTDFMLEPLRGDARYKEMLKKLNLPE